MADRGSRTEIASLEERYREFVVGLFQHLSFRGVSRLGKPITLPLEDVYVELRAVADFPEAADTFSAEERRLLIEDEARGGHGGAELRVQLDSLRALRWRTEDRTGQRRFQRRSIDEAIADPRHPGLVILGDPGSGKTTLLRYLALRAARTRPEAGVARLPIFVRLAAYDDWLRRNSGSMSLGRFLAASHEDWRGRNDLDPLFQEALDEGRALVLLDGLDEVRDATTRQHVAEQAHKLIRQHRPHGNRFALTSRIIGYREAPLPQDLLHVTVLDFGETEIASFSHRWCTSYEISLAGERTDAALQRAAVEEAALLADVHANPSILRLASSPLLIAMLAVLRRQDRRLPDQRIRLYERYVDALLGHWEQARSEGARLHAPELFDRKQAVELLVDLSIWLQLHMPGGTMARRNLVRVVAEMARRRGAKDGEAEAERFLEHMRNDASGLLVERGLDAFGFLHLTFQEYFAGLGLARMEPEARWAVLRENLHQPRWREPILLAAGQLGAAKGQSAASELARRILEAGSPHEEILHRDLFLAVDLAADGVPLERGFLDGLAARLIPLGRHWVGKVRRKALRGLAQLARLGQVSAAAWLEEGVRQKNNPWETPAALDGILGADACASLRGALIEWLDDRHWWAEAIDALRTVVATDGEVRRLILDKLHAAIDGGSASYHTTRALKTLGALGPCEAEILRLILDKLDDPDNQDREHFIEALGPRAVQHADVRERVLASLDHRGHSVRSAAVLALEPVLASDHEAMRLVLARLDDADSWVRRAAINALAPLVVTDENVCRLLRERLYDREGWVRRSALRAIKPRVAIDAELRLLVRNRIDDADDEVRQEAVETLGDLAASDDEVRRVLRERIKGPEGPTRQAAIRAIRSSMSSDAEVRRLIIDGLEPRDAPESYWMAAALRALPTASRAEVAPDSEEHAPQGSSTRRRAASRSRSSRPLMRGCGETRPTSSVPSRCTTTRCAACYSPGWAMRITRCAVRSSGPSKAWSRATTKSG